MIPTGGWSRWNGVRQIVSFNWPQFAAGIATIGLSGAGLALFAQWSSLWWVSAATAFTATYFVFASVLVSYWVYDASGLTDWRWIQPHLLRSDGPVSKWLNVHCGFDQTSRRLRELFPVVSAAVVELRDPCITELSIRRARSATQHDSSTLTARPEAIPSAENAYDVVFLLFAAHELRSATAREQLFHELARVLRPGGRLLVVEHLRDVANVLAFGPGAWHFLPAREWERLGRSAKFDLVARGWMTPFVAFLAWEKPR